MAYCSCAAHSISPRPTVPRIETNCRKQKTTPALLCMQGVHCDCFFFIQRQLQTYIIVKCLVVFEPTSPPLPSQKKSPGAVKIFTTTAIKSTKKKKTTHFHIKKESNIFILVCCNESTARYDKHQYYTYNECLPLPYILQQTIMLFGWIPFFFSIFLF